MGQDQETNLAFQRQCTGVLEMESRPRPTNNSGTAKVSLCQTTVAAIMSLCFGWFVLGVTAL